MNWNEITSFFDVPKDRNNFMTEHLSKEIQNLFLQIFKRAFYCSEEKVIFLLEVFSGGIVRGFLLHQEDSKPEGLDVWF